jgi:hypothetical protein
MREWRSSSSCIDLSTPLLCPGESALVNHWTESWVGSEPGLTLERKYLAFFRGLNKRHSGHKPLLYRLSYLSRLFRYSVLVICGLSRIAGSQISKAVGISVNMDDKCNVSAVSVSRRMSI